MIALISLGNQTSMVNMSFGEFVIKCVHRNARAEFFYLISLAGMPLGFMFVCATKSAGLRPEQSVMAAVRPLEKRYKRPSHPQFWILVELAFGNEKKEKKIRTKKKKKSYISRDLTRIL